MFLLVLDIQVCDDIEVVATPEPKSCTLNPHLSKRASKFKYMASYHHYSWKRVEPTLQCEHEGAHKQVLDIIKAGKDEKRKQIQPV